MSSPISLPRQAAALLLTCVAVGAGCSSSGSVDPALSVDTESDATSLDDGTDQDAVVSNPVMPDPAVKNSIRVDFDITVPAYMSNALQVKLEWGDKSLNANWVGDEMWSASDDFPTDTEQQLTVTFNDDNGGRTLGTVETNFRTGTNAMETFTVTGDQFNTDRWDDDNDGLSNLSELILGTDPSVDETSGLVVRETYPRHDDFEELMLVSAAYESKLPTPRPHFEDATEQVPCFRFPDDPSIYEKQIVQTIDLDALGNGSFLYTFLRNCTERHVESSIATRTNTGSSIQWAGTEIFSDTGPGFNLQLDFTTETTALGNGAWRQEGVIDREKYGFGREDSGVARISYTISGKVIKGSNDCEIAEGTLSLEGRQRTVEVVENSGHPYSSYTGPEATSTIYVKGADDEYWTVTSENDGQLVDQYRVQSLDAAFYCGFAELPTP